MIHHRYDDCARRLRRLAPARFLVAPFLVGPGVAFANDISNPNLDVGTVGWPDPFRDADTEVGWTDAAHFAGAPGSGSLELRNRFEAAVVDGLASVTRFRRCLPPDS